MYCMQLIPLLDTPKSSSAQANVGHEGPLDRNFGKANPQLLYGSDPPLTTLHLYSFQDKHKKFMSGRIELEEGPILKSS